MTINTFNHQGVDDQFLIEVQTHRASGEGRPFRILPEHLVARDTFDRSCLHIALLKTRDYFDYNNTLEVFSSLHPSKVLGWPSLLELEGILRGPHSRTEPWEGRNLQHIDVPNIPIDCHLVRQLIDAGANVKSVDSEGNYCLHYAVENEDACDLIPLLLNAGAKLESSNKYGDTPLLTAVKVNNLKAVEILIKSGADIDASNYHEDTCLHLAGDSAMLNLLLDAGCTVSVNCTNQCGCSPFLVAVEYCDVKSLVRMIQLGADVNFQHRQNRLLVCANWKNPLSMAVAYNRNEIVEVLLMHGANPNVIVRGAVKGQTNILSYAASYRLSYSDCNISDSTEMEKTAKILQLMIDYGANVRDSVDSFRDGITKGSLEVVNLFVDKFYRQSIRIPNVGPLLHLALRNRRQDVCRFILESNFHDIDHADKKGYTAFHRSIKNFENKERAELLLDYGADLNTVSKQGRSVLDTALDCHNIACVEFLLSYGSLSSWRIRMSNLNINLFQNQPRHPNHQQSIERIIKYLTLIESLDRLPEPHLLTRILEYSDSNKELYERCKIEVRLLQQSFIKQSVTVFDILRKIDHRYARDEDLVKKINSENLYRSFPIYGSLIRDRFVESQKMLKRVSASLQNLYRLLKFDYPMFYQVYDNILCRLRYIDLLNLQRI